MANPAHAVIGRTTKITGRVTGEGDLLVEGRIDGDLSLTGNLHVGVGGTVEAPVAAQDVDIDGTIIGDVQARGAVTLRASGSILGGIRAERMAMEEGAKFSGLIDMPVELPAELTAELTNKRG